MGALACELRDTVRWGLMQTNSEKFCRQPVLRLLPACHYEKLLLLFLCTGPNINICIRSSDCCHIFGWEFFFGGGPTLSRLLSQPTCFKSDGDNVCQMVALSWATKYKFILPRSEHLRQMKEIAEGTKDLEVESFTKATSSSSLPALLQL